MSQLQLFVPAAREPVHQAPDLTYIRKSLHQLLRLVRDAEILPWSRSETAHREKFFPELAASLPPDEADTLTAEFRCEITRLCSAEREAADTER